MNDNKPHVPYMCLKQQFRRLEVEEEEEEEESSEERVPGAGACPVNQLGSCQSSLTKRNGNCKQGKRAMCVLCTECKDYTRGWCQNCAQWGDRTKVNSKNEIAVGNKFKNCMNDNKPHVPYMCLKQQFRRLEVEEEEEEEESSEERELGARCPVNQLGACQSSLTKANGA